jgi:choline kinase
MTVEVIDHARLDRARATPHRDGQGAPRRAILLSAGRGTRLGELTLDRPKCLLNFSGRTLLDWQIASLRACGIEDIVVVTGFGAARVAREVDAGITTFYNPFYQVADNLASLWLAREYMDHDFLVLNGDTLVAPQIIRTLLDEATAPISVTVTRKAEYDEDDMKVTLDGLSVRAVSKKLSPEMTNAESIGLLAFAGAGVSIFRQAIELAMSDPTGVQNWYLSVVDMLARQSVVGAVEVPLGLSAEVDYPADVPIAAALAASWALPVAIPA